MRKAKRKSFDWYGMRQHFSIRKFHFGAASVLLGMSLILGAGATVISAEESTIVPPAQEVVVGEEQKATETNVTDAQAKNVTALSETEVVPEVENTAVAVQAESSPVEEVQPVLPPVVEETVTVRRAVISYTVRHIDASENVLSSESLSVEVTTSDAQARHQVLVSSNLPEGYRLVAGQATEQTVDIVEGRENLITFRLEKVEMEEKKQVTEPASSQEVAKAETVSPIVDKPAEKQEPAVAVKSLIPAETTHSDTQPLAEATKELSQPVIERTVNIPYKVVQTDVETGEEKKLGQVGYVSVTTTDEVAKTEVTVTADKLRSGYRLADGQPNVITKVVAENETNILSFAVTRKKDEKDNPLTETTTAASGNAEGTSGFRAIENATRSANTVSYVTTEWQVPDEAKTAGANFDKAASDASVSATTTVVPEAYRTTLPEGREVFMVLNLASQKEPNKATTFNNKYKKDYFFQFSTAKEGEINKVYADLVDKRQSNKILESIEIAQGSTGKFNTLAQYEKDNYTYRFQFTPDPSNSTSKNLKINNPHGGNINTIIYDKVSPNSIGTELNIHNVLVPVRTTQETKYVVKATDKRAEETLATFIQKGALTGDSYTIAGALDFDKYELIAEDVPTVLKGDLAADYKVGAKTIQAVMSHNLVRVLEVTKKDGTHKAHIYLLNPDGPNRLTLDRKTEITEADLTSENFIKFFTSEDIVPGAVNTLEGSYSYTSKHQFESFKTTPHTFTNVITGETMLFNRNGQNYEEGNFFIPEHKAVSLKGKDGKAFGFGGATLRMVNDNVANEQHVTYYYAEKGSVIIHYVNDKGETIKRSATLVGHGATGELYDTKNYKHFSVFTGEGDALDQYFLKGIDPASSTLRPVTEDSNELRRIVKIDSETGAVERDTLKELTYVYEKAAKALVEIYLRPVDVETGAVSGPDKLDHTIREQGRKETIIPKRITLDILQNYIDRGYEVISDGFSNKTTYYDSIEDGVGTVAPSQVYKIVLRERIKTVTPDAPKEPNTPIDPTNPTGPKYPEGVRATDLNESVKRTIKYQYEGGAEARPTVEETLTFTRTAKVNVVTGALAYTPWTSTDDDFNEVVSPTIDGYEADKPTVEAVQDVPYNAQDTEVIVTYRKDAQKATITYKDDKGKTLGKVDEVTGKSGEPINYTTTARITELTNQGYEVVTDGFTKEGGQVFDTDKATDQPFEVVVRAKVVTVTPEDPKNPGTPVDPGNPAGPEWPDGLKESDLNQTVTRVIKYQYEDGSEAQPDVVETLTYKRTATVNLVTKEVTYGEWTSTDNAFDKVDTPAIAGYTADKASVEAVQDVPATDPDTEVIVRYVKDAQKATITYQDEGGKQLGAIDEVTGKSGEPISYTTTARITELTNQGYEVVTDGFTKEGGQVFDTDKATDQPFEVVVRAKVVTVTPEDPKNPGTPVDPGNPDGPKWPDGVKESDLNQTVTRVIKYQYEDGSQAQPDVVETLTYKRTATVNLVTKEVTYGEWTSTDNAFDKVDTPTIAGYTPDKASVAAEANVPAEAADKEVIVKYVKDAQKATITYKDDKGTTLGSVDEVTGKSGEPITYTTTARITELKNKGYEVVTDGFTKDGGQVFDTDKTTDQPFEVVVRAKVVTVTPEDPKNPGTEVDPGNPDGPKWPDGVKESDLNQTVTRVIKYQYEDGSQAKPDMVETLTYKRTATVNLVTKEVTYGEWTSTDNDFDKVDTPAIAGYTPDKASVAAEADVPAEAADKEVIVRYVKDAQKATITYKDDKGKTLGTVDEVTGKSGEPINYTTTARITELTNQGYEVVTDGFTKEGGQVFDTDKTTDQPFEVVVRAKVVTVTPEDPKNPGTPVDPGKPDGPKWPDGVKESDLNQTVTRVIKYQYEDGSQAQPDVVETLTYKRTATVNLVTKEVTYGDWTSTDDDFDKVDTPAIAGYTPDKASVEAEADVPAEADDKEVIVRYVKDAQKATITYKDDKGKTLGTVDEVTGKSGEPINYTTTARITELTNQGYEVVTDGFTKEGGQVFDTDKATDQPFEVVVREKVVTVTPEDPKNPGTPVDPGKPDGPKWPDGVKESDLNQTVTRTIKYQYEDGSKAKPDVVETLTYKRTATVNLVTKEVTYGDWTSTDDDFDKVDTPAIAGYTPDKASVEAVQDVPATDPDTEVIVRYVKDAQKATITYKDDKGKTLGNVDEVTGKSGEPINYTTTARITELINEGYEVVTDGFTKEGGQVFDTDKATDQAFTVVVKAKTVTVTPEDPKNPGTEVDPGKPDGPKWPDGLKESDLNQTVTRVIKYQYEDGSQAQPDVVETLTYKRTATVNLVTKEVTYGDWTSTDDDFDKVDTPAIAGYTPDKASVEAVQDVPATDPDTEVIVRYVKDAQKATITYKDDKGKTLGNVDEVTGKSGEPINYTTTARITELINEGYEVVTDGFTKEGGQVFDTDKATDQAFTVVVKAKTVTVTPEDPKNPGTPVDPGKPDGPKWPDGVKESDLNQTVTRTIKYQYEDGSKAKDDVVETLTYKRTATVNLVTKEVTYGDWTSTDDDFDKVDTPAIAGYTPDKASVEAVQDVPATDPDTEVIVRYVKDAQKATITYKDDKGKTLGNVDEVTGKSGEPINYTTTARITELTNQGYEVVTDGFTKDGGQVFDTDKTTDQPFEVVVRAKVVTVTPEDPKNPGTPVDPGKPDGPKWPDGVKESDLNQTVTRVIKYQYEDGSQAKPDVVETLTYKRTATVNLVTKEVTYGDWTSTDSTFDKVDTPAIAGYTSDKASVAAEADVPAESADKEVIVKYVKDSQKATITYKDEAGKQLGEVDQVTGKSGEPINYTTTARITELTNQGYEVVTDGFTKDGGQVFDTDKATDQPFEVVVRAKVVTVTPEDPKNPGTPVDPGNPDGPKWPDGVKESDLNQTVTRVIKYQYEDGSQAQPDVVETLTYKRTATVNLVTKEVTYGEWTSTDNAFDKVDTPAIAGYTPDKASVAAEANVPAEAADKEVIVKYVKDAQKATITYKDDKGTTLGTVDEVTGKSGEPINYTTTARITELKNKGYEVVTDGFTKDGGQVFDTDKTTDQPFEVVVRAKVVTVTPEDPKNPGTPVDPGKPDGPKWPDGLKESDLNQTVTRTIKYQYEDGSEAQPDVVETLTYKRTATVNLVTKEVTYGDWTSTDDDFDKVDTPAIAGYTPDKASVAAEADVPATDPDKEVIVKYVKDAQKATITYKDDKGTTLGTVDEVTGKSGEPINYTTTARITELKNKGYEVVTDGFTKDGGQVFDTDKATDQPFEVVVRAKVVTVTPEDPKNPGAEVDPGNPDGPKWPDGVKESDLNQTVTRTIKYQYEDGSKAQPDVVETLTYKRTATVNLVTKEVTYGDWTSTDDDFDKVDTPAIAGYTPDKASVAAEADVPAEAADKEVIVRYVKDAQKATITYKDDKGKTLGTVDEVTGKSGEPINYTTTARITELTNQGYEVVTDGFTKDGGQVFDTDKATDQPFEVVVRAKVVTVTPEDPKNPGTEVDPGNPDGPEWPDGLKESDLNQTVTRTIKYQYEDGSQAKDDVVETLTYKRTATVNLVTKEVTYGDWTSTDDDFDKVDTPAIAGYTPDKASVAAEADVPAEAADKEVIVRYVKDAQKATITYKDDKGTTLGNVDEVTGKSGEPINYTTTARITELTNQGYEVVTDGFTKEGGQVFDTDKATDQPFEVVVREKVVTVTPEDPKNPGTEVDPGNPAGPEWPDGLKESDLNQTVTRVIKYQYEDGSEAQPDVVETLTYKRTATVNLVTKEVTYGEWTSTDNAFDKVDTPAIAGYTPDKVSVEAVQDVPATDPDTEVIVRYVKDAQKATITYKDDKGKTLGKVDEVTGKSGEPINYSTTARITELTNQGYEVVTDGFTKDGGQVYDKDKATDQSFEVVVRAKVVTVTPEDPKNPGTPVDPGKPDGPKWPDGVKESDLNQTVTRTIKYQYEDGSQAQPDVVETLTYKRTATVNLATKEVTYGEWTSTDKTFDKVDTPAIAGYTPDKASVEAEADVPAESADKEVTVTYVKDVPKEATVTVKYVDENGREILPPETITGKVGDPYTASGKVISGYYLVEVPANQTGTISASGTTVVYVYGKLGSWVPSVPTGVDPVPPIPYPNDPMDPSKPGTDLPVLPHVPGHIPVGPDGVSPLTPVDPSDPSKGYILPPVPSNPGTDTPITYVPEAPKEATVTVKYVDENGREILPPETITGKIGDPYTTNGKVISGYYLVEVPANQTGTISASGTTVVYVYGKLGSWVPSVPTGVDPVPPIPYPNDPTDPSKPGTDLPVLPHVPGHIPVGPDGVTPLTPVDPSDPSKGYILPPVPSNPGTDTPITYVPEAPKEATVTVKYVDENGLEILPPETITGKIGDPYTTNGKVISGYYLVEVPANQTGTISASGTTVVYVYGKLGSWVPSVPTGVDSVPPIPYPNDPTDPSKPGTDLPVLPHVPGHVPVGPDGVTPLIPVDPSDPSKGYILPPVPSNPGTDTPITYVPVPQPQEPILPEPTQPTPPALPTQPSAPVKPMAPVSPTAPASPTQNTVTADKTSQRTLPNTGDSSSDIALMAGISLLMATLGMVVKARKED